MTESMKFTNPSAAPVSCTLACASGKTDAENDLRLARAIDVELDGRGTEQHVKIKVGTLRVLADAVMSLAKGKSSLEAALAERSEDLALSAGKLEDWRAFTRHILDQFFFTYPTSDTNDGNLRVLLRASIEFEHNKRKQLSKDYDAMRNSSEASDQLRKAAELERDDAIKLNRNAAEEIQHLSKDNDNLRNTIHRMEVIENELKQQRSIMNAKVNSQGHEIANLKKRNEHLDQTVVELVRQRDTNGQQANQLACEVNDLKKQRERLTHLADDYRRDLDAAARRCVALTNDAQALIKQRDEVTTRLANAKLQIADLKRQLDGEVVQSAAVYSNIRSHAEAQENAFLKRIAVLEGENRELATKLANAGLEIANYQRLAEDLKAGTAVDQDTLKRQARKVDALRNEVEQMDKMLTNWKSWASDLICSPSTMSMDAQRKAIGSVMLKRKERIETLEATVKAIAAQRDAWVLWAKSYTDTCAVAYTNEQLVSLVKAKVKVSTVDIDGQQTMCGTLKVTKLKDDVVVSDEPVKEYSLPGVRSGTMILNGVIHSGSIQARKVTFSDEMKAAIREVIEKEIAPINSAITDILSKMRK